MPMHRRRVYMERGAGRRSRIEGWLSLSIFVSTVVLLFSLLGCMPELVYATRKWLTADPHPLMPVTAEPTPALVLISEASTMLSGSYLLVALLLKSSAR